jgi:hypothetical protein
MSVIIQGIPYCPNTFVVVYSPPDDTGLPGWSVASGSSWHDPEGD